jgi:outer membrane protein TolC
MNTSLRSIIIAVMLLAAAPFVAAAETVTLDSLIAQARQHNSELIAARQKWEAAKERVTQEKTWDKPRLTVEYWSVPEGTFDLSAANEKMYGIGQMVPFPGKLKARGKAAGFEAEAMGWETRDTELKVLANVKSSYAMYYSLTRAIETYRQTAGLMQMFGKVAESRYVTGRSSQSDILRAQIEAEKMSNMVITLQQERETVKTELNLLTGKNADEALGEPQDITPHFVTLNWEAVKAKTLASSTEIGRGNAALGQSKWVKTSAQLDYLPDFDLGFRRKKVDEIWSGSDVMVSMSVPLWFWKQKAGVREMAANQSAADAGRRNAELMAVATARETFTKLDAARRLLELYSASILPKSEQSLAVTQASFTAGKTSFLELLDSVRSYLEFKLDYYNYIAEYEKNLAMLERTVGAELR